MSKEVEIKIRVLSAQLDRIEKWLQKNAQFVSEENHREFYINDPNKSFYFINDEGIKDANDYFRIRTSKNGKASICLKQWQPDPKRPGQHTHCEEYETLIDDSDSMIKLMEAIGYKDKVVVEKYRRKYKYDSFEIVIDDVKDLGVFIEIEYKGKFEDVYKARNLIFEFVRDKFGLDSINMQNRGYVSMLINPDYDFGEIVNISKADYESNN